MKKLDVNGYIIADEDKWLYDTLELPNITLTVFRAFLKEADGEDIEIVINSYGGDVWSASSMYAELRDYKGTSTAKIIGLSASAATFLMLGADKVIASPMAAIMIHNAQAGANGDYREMEHTAQILKNANETIINAYEIKTGKSRDVLQEYMDNETWLSAQDAVELGIVDEIDLKKGEKLSPIKESAFLTNKIAACVNPIRMHELAQSLKNGKPGEPEETVPPIIPPNVNGEVTQPVADTEPETDQTEPSSSPVNPDYEHQNNLRKKIYDYKEE